MKTSGTIRQCLHAYAETLPRATKNATAHRKDLKEFLDMSYPTVERIINEKTVLLGLTLVKLARFLEHKGFTITELQKMPQQFRLLGDIVAYGIMSVEDLRTTLGYEHTNGVYRLLNGEARADKISPDKLEKIIRLCEMRAGDVREKREEWSEIIAQLPGTSKSAPKEARVEADQAPTPKKRTLSDDETIIAGIVKALEEPLKRVLGQAISAADRKRIREAIGVGTLFGVSTDLNRLGSEAAFTQYAPGASRART